MLHLHKKTKNKKKSIVFKGKGGLKTYLTRQNLRHQRISKIFLRLKDKILQALG